MTARLVELDESDLPPSQNGHPRDPDVHVFLAQPDPPAGGEAVPHVLAIPERVIVTGGEGGGKSTLLRQIGTQCSAGVHPFTLEPIEPLRVLLVDLENSETHVRARLRGLVAAAADAGRAIAPDTLVPLVQPGGLDLLGKDDRLWLERRIAANQPQLVVLGPIYKLASEDTDEAKIAKPITAYLDDLRQTYKFALLLEAHSPHEQNGTRAKRPIGSSLWMRWPEFGLNLGGDGALTHWRGAREERTWPKRLERGSPWPWVVSDDGTTEDGEWRPRRLMERISRFLEDGETRTTNQILDFVSGNTKYLRQAIEYLVSDGYVERKRAGQAQEHRILQPFRETCE